MRQYQTTLLDSTIEDCLQLDLKIRSVLQLLIKNFDYSELSEELIDIKDKYGLFKSKLLHTSNEVKINILELESEPVFKKYVKYLEIKTSSLKNIMGPSEIEEKILESDLKDLYDDFEFDDFIIYEVPGILDHLHITSFLYTYSFMLNIYCNALLGLSIQVSFQGLENLNTDIFEPQVTRKLNKLKSKLSVPQLAYFFKVLVSEDFFNFKHKKDIYQFISTNFSTKGIEEISFHSIKNKYESPDLETINFMQEKFIHFTQIAKKDKDNF